MSDADLSTDAPPVLEPMADAVEIEVDVAIPASAAPAASPAPPAGPAGWKYTLPGGLLRAARPRQWIKNVLVFAAPGAAGISLRPGNLLPGPGRLRRLVPRLVRHLPGQRRHGRRRRPAPSPQAAPAGGVGRGPGQHRPGRRARASWSSGPARPPPGAPRASPGSSASTPSSPSPTACGSRRWPSSTWRRWRRASCCGPSPAAWPPTCHLELVPHRRLVRVAVHGGRQAARRAPRPAGRAGRPPGHARATTRSASSATCGRCRRAWPSPPTACGPSRRPRWPATRSWFQLSIVPFVLAILRYALLLDAGQGGAPEEVVLGDRTAAGPRPDLGGAVRRRRLCRLSPQRRPRRAATAASC